MSRVGYLNTRNAWALLVVAYDIVYSLIKYPEREGIEGVKIKYEAKAIILVYNEVHYKGESSEIFFNRNGYMMKQPVLELHFAKNKISSFKGRLFYEFYPELSRLEEPDEDSIRRYAGLVYS